ncbi:hypothetical protein Bca52824_045869 [Brassica carinata]|nr:hypothetical protein Bca52824_045869 [Brassica carinata]VDD13161.1 unnamed protein product [Brassica oleracea]
MEGRIQALVSMILIVTLCATILLQPGLAEVQVTPQFTSFPGSPIDLTKCWSSLFSAEDCVIDIYKFSVTGKFGINQACCKAFMDMDDKCWPKMFPFNPFFRPLLKNSCSRINGVVLTHTTPHQVPTIPGVSHPGSPVDLTKCWSSLTSVQGCVTEIYKSVFTGKFDNVGPMCCKAASAVDAKCWPHMFPLNTFFPRLLKESCSRIINEAEPTHK